MLFVKKSNSRSFIKQVITLNSLNCDLYSVLDNQTASKNTSQATRFKGAENSRTFQGLVQK